ncbi:hypothetical protein EG835_00660 [bacterium]|nr:hypothetical protein [bacterium]
MSKAAYCAACGANVYLNDDGLCPQGHAPENLSNFYDAPDLTPADHAQYDALAPVEKRKTSKTLVIVLVLIGLLVLCGVGACALGVIGYRTITSSSTESSSGPTVEVTPADEGTSPAPFDAEVELRGLTGHFFPTFEPTTYYLVGEATDDPLKYQVLAVSTAVPQFRMIFTALRYADGSLGPDDDPAWFYETGLGAVWERSLDYADDAGVSLLEFAGGPDAVIDDAGREQIETDFVAAHPTKVVSDFAVDAEGRFGLLGFDESELDNWMGDITTFASWWAPNDAGIWVETAFSE